MNRVFFSYATEDRVKVKDYRSAFIDAGLEPLVDYGEIAAGKAIAAGINRMIETSQGAVLFFSEAYLRKPWTNEEQSAVFFRCVDRGDYKVVVVRLDDAGPLPPLLAHRVWLHAPESAALARVFAPDLRSSVNGSASGKIVVNWLEVFSSDDLERLAVIISSQLQRNSSIVAVEMHVKASGSVVVHLAQPVTERLADQLAFVIKMLSNVNFIRGRLRGRLSTLGLGIFEGAFMLAERDQVEKIEEFRAELRETLGAMVEKITLK
jgi:hypothetical protein